MGCISQKERGLGPPPRRNARSLDLCASREPSKAAAWLWHMHTGHNSPSFSKDKLDVHSTVWESRKRSSSFGRTQSRFRQEAAAAMASASAAHQLGDPQPPSPQGASARVWDCGSKLYDMFELVSFSNRLDRSLLGIVPALTPPSPSPSHSDFAGVHRTFSLPMDFSLETSMPMAAPSSSECGNAADPPLDVPKRISEEASGCGSLLFDLQEGCLNDVHGRPSYIDRKLSSPHQHPLAARCALTKLVHTVKKLLKFYTHLQCFVPPAPSRKRSFKHRKSCDEVIDKGTPTSQRSWWLSSSSETVGGRRCDAMEEDGDGGNRKYLYRVHAEKAKWRKGGKHFHHHHHHYHHHFVHHVDQFSLAASDGIVCNHPVTMDGGGADWDPALCDQAPSLHAESARFSCDT